MTVSMESIEEFRRLWKVEFGEELTVEQARLEAERLLEFYRVLAGPLPKDRESQAVITKPRRDAEKVRTYRSPRRRVIDILKPEKKQKRR